jgi:hypothetical protein
VTKQHGYEEVDDECEHWDLNWTDLSVSEHRVAKMLPFQRVNHFPGMLEICRKVPLSRHLKKMRSVTPSGTYDFVPETWEHPKELETFRKHCKLNPGGSYIVKPTAGAMGRGIYLIKNPEQIDRTRESAAVVQKYLRSPFLLDGYKFDLRIYAMVTRVDPLTVYVYDEGIARLATVKYQRPTAANLNQKTMHLTNYSLNKRGADFVNTETEDDGTKRALTALWRDLRAKGHDVDALWMKIKDLVVKTIVPIGPLLAHAYHSAVLESPRIARDETRRSASAGRPKAHAGNGHGSPFATSATSATSAGRTRLLPRPKPRVGVSDTNDSGNASTRSRCFEILGFDVLLDDALEPFLIEVNHSPSFGMDSPLDARVKTGLIGDALRALAPDPSDRTRWIAEEKKRRKRRLYETAARRGAVAEKANAAFHDSRRKTNRRAEAEAEAERPSGAAPGSRKARGDSSGSADDRASLRARLAAFDADGGGDTEPVDRGFGGNESSPGGPTARRPRPPGTTNPTDPPERLGDFHRVLPAVGADALATQKKRTFTALLAAAESLFAPVPGCGCPTCDARDKREALSYAVAHARKVAVEGDAAPLDDRGDAFLSSFPFSRDSPKAFRVGPRGTARRDGMGSDRADGGPARTYASLAGKASLCERKGAPAR